MEPTKLNRADFIKMIEEHCLPEVSDESLSKKIISDWINRMIILRGRPSSTDISTLNRHYLITYLTELTKPTYFEYDYNPNTLSNENVLVNENGWVFTYGRTGTKRIEMSKAIYSEENKILARDEGIEIPSEDRVIGFSTNLPTDYPIVSIESIMIMNSRKMAFYSLPIRFKMEEIAERIPRIPIVHPDCPEIHRPSEYVIRV